MAEYDINNAVKFGALKSLAQRTKTELTALDEKYSTAFRSMSVANNTVSFFTSTDASGTAADNSININGYNVNVKISAAANNSITLRNDGLHVDISGKADKVANATAGNLAGLDANGNITDSGVTFASDNDVNAMLTEVFGA